MQAGALGLHRAGLTEPPAEAEAWRDLLRGLTPEFPDDEPWSLVAPLDKPALLQPPVPEGSLAPLKNTFATPDEIDTLVTAKNHDVKAARIVTTEPDDWLYALAQLQTCEGFPGAGNYGVSRMNGGFANRPGVGIAPPGGFGRRVRRDIRRLIELRPELTQKYGYLPENGLGLVWLKAWDGTASLTPGELDPFYVEVCRRMRLAAVNGQLAARGIGTKVPRIAIAKSLNGITGDPWTPIDEGDGKDPPKALTVDGRGFHYRRTARILFQDGYRPAPLQQIAADEEREGLIDPCLPRARPRPRQDRGLA